MARDVNWWLMSLAFLLGLLLTLTLTIRRVTREVPVKRTVEVPKPNLDKVAGSVAATGAGAVARLHAAAEKVETKLDEKVAHVEQKNTEAFEHAEHVLEREPHAVTPAEMIVNEGHHLATDVVVTEGHHVSADIVVTEVPHAVAETVVTEHHSPPADATLVIIDDGIPEAESRIRIVGTD